MITIHQQITWMNSQVMHMSRTLPPAVKEGRVTEAQAAEKMACAKATLNTLMLLRSILRAEEMPHG